MGRISESVKLLLREIPEYVKVVAAAKERTPEEVSEAVSAGIKIVGENYLQEAQEKIGALGHIAKWHFIGSIQKRKIRKIVELFDLIQSVDSLQVVYEIDKWAEHFRKIMPVLVEVNSCKEPQKSGVMPEYVERFLSSLSCLSHIRVLGLMTMGPALENPEEIRPFFALTNRLFVSLCENNITNVRMEILSMGMSDSYKIAIEEGANMIRVGTLIFGPRTKKNI